MRVGALKPVIPAILTTYVAITNVFRDQTVMIDIAPSTPIVQSVKAVVIVSAMMAIT